MTKVTCLTAAHGLVSALLLQSNREGDLEEPGVVINSVDRMWGRINGPGEVNRCAVSQG